MSKSSGASIMGKSNPARVPSAPLQTEITSLNFLSKKASKSLEKGNLQNSLIISRNFMIVCHDYHINIDLLMLFGNASSKRNFLVVFDTNMSSFGSFSKL